MSEGVFGYGLGGALGAKVPPGHIVRVPDIADAMALTFHSSICDQPFSCASAGSIPAFIRELRPKNFPGHKQAPLLGETYMYPDERPVEPL